jgi:hypothetical protein
VGAGWHGISSLQSLLATETLSHSLALAEFLLAGAQVRVYPEAVFDEAEQTGTIPVDTVQMEAMVCTTFTTYY